MADTAEKCSPDQHGPIVTAADNAAEYDPAVLGPTPNTVHYGYCAKCRTPMHWSPERMGWGEWDR
jgi:hypothetical protein